MTTLTPRGEDYLLREAEQLRNLYADSIKEIAMLERYTLLATGAIWSWGASQKISEYLSFLVWVPLVIQLFFGLRAWGIYQDITWIRKYLSGIETTLGLPDELGWGHRQADPRLRLRIITGFAFWIALPVLTAVIAIVWR
jgi:hypothetical protein